LGKCEIYIGKLRQNSIGKYEICPKNYVKIQWANMKFTFKKWNCLPYLNSVITLSFFFKFLEGCFFEVNRSYAKIDGRAIFKVLRYFF